MGQVSGWHFSGAVVRERGGVSVWDVNVISLAKDITLYGESESAAAD